MKVLCITNLYPNHLQKGRGIFNKQQFSSLSKLCELKVVAPIPWVPPIPFISKSSLYKDIKEKEEIDGIDVYHPRYLVTPKIGRDFYGWHFFRSVYPLAKNIKESFDYDLIFGTWAYPDCYAAALISQKLNVPFVARVHGTDINETTQYPFRRKMIRTSLNSSKAIVANSKGLIARMQEIGIQENKFHFILNGVDRDIFKVLDKEEALKKCKIKNDRRHILFVGNLVEVKGVRYLIDALREIKDAQLNIIGDGTLLNQLKTQAQQLGVAERINFVGRINHCELAQWFNACDVFCLPSLNEGCPNVVLEALACQTPVVASNVGAIPDLIDSNDKGLLVNSKDADGLAKALKEVLNRDSKDLLKSNVSSWDDNAKEVYKIFESAVK